MNAQQIHLVRESWHRVQPMSDAVAASFYARLFALDPSLRPLFAQTTVQAQGRKLMYTLAFVVAGLERLDELLPQIRDLGRRHRGYGVADAHYITVGRALLGALHEALGDAFTNDVCDAWTAAYTTLAGVMRAAAAEAQVIAGAVAEADAGPPATQGAVRVGPSALAPATQVPAPRPARAVA
jgi:nitric oxide dioxygenase